MTSQDDIEQTVLSLFYTERLNIVRIVFSIYIRKWLFALTKVRIASSLFALMGVNILWSSTSGFEENTTLWQ